MRYLLSSAFVLCLCLTTTEARADERPKDAVKATVVKVDDTGNKITLKWTDKEGKAQEKEFEVKDTVKMYGKENKPAKLNEFRTGGTIYFTMTGDNLAGLWIDAGKEKDPKNP
jgi:uncharacterized protein YigE (DUF2233 family)